MSSRQSRAAVCAISGRSAPATRRVSAKPGRSECATTASMTAVRGRPVRRGAQRRGVGLHDRARALAVDDLHRDRARVGAAERGVHRHAEPLADGEGHLDEEPVLGGRAVDGRGAEHRERGERVGVQPGAVPRVEPVGDHVLAARSARSRWRRRRRCPAGGRGPSTGASVTGPSARSSSRTQASTPSSCAGRVRQPGPAAGAQRHAVPAADQVAARAPGRRTARRPGAGRRRARHAASPSAVAPGHQLAARDRPARTPAPAGPPGSRPARTSRRTAGPAPGSARPG